MKYKKYLFLIFVFGLFLIFPFSKVSAKNLNVGIDFDNNEHFNYFYEMKNNTSFYQFLVGKSDTLKSYLLSIKSCSSINGCGGNYSIYIINKSDFLKLNFDNDTIINNFDSLDFSYVFILHNFDKYTSSFFSSVSGDTFLFKSYTGSNSDDYTFYFYDDNVNLVSTYNFSLGINKINLFSNLSFVVKDNSLSSSSSFSYLLSFYYNSLSGNYLGFNNISYDYVISDLYIDNRRFIIDDNENYSSFKAFFRNLFTSTEDYDVSNSSLDYFRLFKVISDNKLYSLFYMLSYNSSKLSVPDGYVSAEISSNSGFLIPKVNTSNKYSTVYAITSGLPSINIRYWKFNVDDNSISYLGDDLILNYQSSQSDVLSKFNLIKDTTKLTGNFYDYMYQLGYQYVDGSLSAPLKYSYTIYYHPDVYTYIDFDTSKDLTSYLPGTHTSFTITADDIISASNSSGASVNIFLDADSQVEYAKENSDLDIDYDSAYTLTSAIKDSTKIVSVLKVSITAILTLVTTLFTALPTEIRLLLTFSLSMGIVIIFVKIIRG